MKIVKDISPIRQTGHHLVEVALRYFYQG